ncbi:MAG: DUF4924 family protein, partial [Muribaculaceae bacterium]|nr:DUF4924 family protein [Muribaculaceae bacterium]
YMILMLRMKGQEISKETSEALGQIYRFMAMLSHYYKKDYNNQLFTDSGDDM